MGQEFRYGGWNLNRGLARFTSGIWVGDWDYQGTMPALKPEETITLWFATENGGHYNVFIDNINKGEFFVNGMAPNGQYVGHFTVGFTKTGNHSIRIEGQNIITAKINVVAGESTYSLVEVPPPEGYDDVIGNGIFAVDHVWFEHDGVRSYTAEVTYSDGDVVDTYFQVFPTDSGAVAVAILVDAVQVKIAKITLDNGAPNQTAKLQIPMPSVGYHSISAKLYRVENGVQQMLDTTHTSVLKVV